MDLEIVEPNQFTVFVGPNGAGKSNIFEALEFWSYHLLNQMIPLFGEGETIINRKSGLEKLGLRIDLTNFPRTINMIDIDIINRHHKFGTLIQKGIQSENSSLNELYKNYSRVFIKNEAVEKIPRKDNEKLSLSASNLEKVLKRILQDEVNREEILEWLQLLIPEFENIEIIVDDFDGESKLKIYEKHTKRPFPKSLISDGTYNILALLTAVYQSDEPQFLCIEEPENGLNPYVIRKMVDLFRSACEEKGHYIWLNTHSNVLVECLTPEELIVVDKIGGETKIKQIKGMDLHGLDMAEVWLSGALGGGTPW